GKFRDGMPVTAEAVTLILSSIDRIKEILGGLEATEAEPEGNDQDLIVQLHQLAESADAAPAAAAAAPPPPPAPSKPLTEGKLAYQVLERELRPGEVSLDELERAFRETAPEAPPPPKKADPPEPKVEPKPAASARGRGSAPKPAEAHADQASAKEPKSASAKKAKTAVEVDTSEADRVANQSIRVNVDTLEHLMTMVSELVLTRNQLLEISRRNEDTEFK